MNRTSPYYCRRSVLSLLISALIYAPPGMAAFTTNVIGVVNDETVDGNQKVDERGTTNNTHIINHGQQNVHGGVSNGSLIESGGYQDIGSHNNFVGQANNTTINGGRQSIHDGGISTGTTIESGNQDVYKGGISNGTTIKGGALMNPLMILVKIIKLRWIHILSYDQMVSRKINNQTTRCANSI
uniref:AIDA repeat-containing protein n=1 Tax=Escherichia coli TaxID=562 RepID=UPI001FCED4BB